MSPVSNISGLGGGIFIILFWIFSAPGARAGNAYLPAVGPSPLRFQAEISADRPPVPQFISVGDMLAEKTNALAAAVTPAVSTSATNAAKAENNSAPVVVGGEAALPSTPANALAEQVVFAPADRFVALTPQMLAEYFRPVPGPTNQVGGVFLPMEVDFRPATPKYLPSSHATYKSE